ncbi:hypothetical protein BKA56DRAFT_506464 [Ilyonectria sp. MPI-CAGE-AT-0026]|nr:hypothetical protein BKA56DRAFT_506464 [Ilyonectria sp. MPI-CAGE-AT-0026]
MPREPPSGIDVLVVGAGLAGLGFAIEAYRKGHNAKILERRPDTNDYGDFITIQSSALRTPENWPGFLEYCSAFHFGKAGTICTYDGTVLGTVEYPLTISRAALHHAFHKYAAKLGIEIKFSSRVMDYFEDDEKAGVILEDGSKLVADVVAAADGIGSRSWNIVSGFKETPISSGFAMFRATFPAEHALKRPLVAEKFGDDPENGFIIVGPGSVHVIIARSKNQMVFLLTHKDEGTAEETWTNKRSVDYALPYVKGWSPFISEVIDAVPDREAVDFKLMWRNPRDTWASPKGRVIQVGDAAHTFLPTSASGATMALEDGYSLAACLQIAGMNNIPLAVKVHNHLRAERVSCGQRMGFKTREVWHLTNWDKFEKGQTFPNVVGSWIVDHDPQQYAYDNYEKCASFLIKGTPFKNTNGVPGYTLKPWTIHELLSAADRGERLEDEGEWFSRK